MVAIVSGVTTHEKIFVEMPRPQEAMPEPRPYVPCRARHNAFVFRFRFLTLENA